MIESGLAREECLFSWASQGHVGLTRLRIQDTMVEWISIPLSGGTIYPTLVGSRIARRIGRGTAQELNTELN